MSESASLSIRLKALAAKLQTSAFKFNRGIERETLRVDSQGVLSQKPHPVGLGSKLSHPMITTDFSEAQLELITPVSTSITEILDILETLHQVVYSYLDNEILWSASMPCTLQGDAKIPLAHYGHSNLGRLKTTYRNGLGNRYGRTMQTVCAVHYNFSFNHEFWRILAQIEGQIHSKDYQTLRYFDLMRNFRHIAWLPTLLFGASPAVSDSFVEGRKHMLKDWGQGTLYLPEATSLRNGHLGYQSGDQARFLNVSYNHLSGYVSGLAAGITTPLADYTRIRGGNSLIPAQLNDSILQSEAEFYTSIRAKRVAHGGSNFLSSLRDDGVEYVEVRLLDINPFEPLGINRETIRFLDTLLLYCLLENSPKDDEKLQKQVDNNLAEVVYRGRNNPYLADQQTRRKLRSWGQEILDNLLLIAEQLDGGSQGEHWHSVARQYIKLDDANKTPSAQILNVMAAKSISFLCFAMDQARQHQQYFASKPLLAEQREQFERLARQSIMTQAQIESEDTIDFDTYLRRISTGYRSLLT